MDRTSRTPNAEGERELTLGRALSILWRGRWIILVTTCLGLFLGGYQVLRRGRIWRAAADVYVDAPQSMGGGLGELLASFGVDNLAHKQAHLMRSDLILERALQGDEEHGIEAVGTMPIFPEGMADVSRVQWLRGQLEISVGRDDEVISVTLDHGDPDAACRVVNSVVDTFAHYVLEQRNDTAEEFLRRYDQEVEALDEAIGVRRGKIETLVRDYDLDPDGVILQRLSESIGRAETHLEETVEQIRQTEAAVRDLAERPPRTPALMALAATIQRLEAERSQRLARYTGRHASVLALDTAIETARAQYESEQTRELERSRVELNFVLETAQSRRARLEERIAEERDRYKELNRRFLEFLELGREAELDRKKLELRMAKIRELDVARVGAEQQALGVEVRSRPVPGRLADVSGRSMRILLAAAMGAMLGGLLAWLLEMLDQRIRGADEVATLLELPILGAMPQSERRPGETRNTALQRWSRDRAFSEAARSLRTQVFFGLPEGEGQVLQVTSPEQGEGKSSVTAQLAMAMAQAGQRTLLIDADLRRPRQALQFGVHGDTGLAEVLAGQADVRGGVIQQVPDFENLAVLPCGAVPPNPSELLNGPRVVEMLAKLREDFDRILVDSPPILPVTDASILAPRCDRTILVLRAEKSTRKRARAAYDTIQRVGARVLGVVLNAVPKQNGYGRRYGYSDYHDYGYHDDHYLRDEAERAPQSARARRPSGESAAELKPQRVRRPVAGGRS